MSRSTPFAFGAGAGSPAPPISGHHQQRDRAPAEPDSLAAPLAQEMAYQQNGQSHRIDMSALAGISPDQVALIARLLQSGALPLPPPPPGAPVQAPPALAPPLTPPSRSGQQREDGVAMDREEGEVEEGEASSTPDQSRPASLPLPSSKTTKRNKARRSLRQDHERTESTSAVRTSSATRSTAPQVNGTGDARLCSRAVKELQSRDFVLAMHQAGYTYSELAQTVNNPAPLRRMFKQLGLPVSSDPDLPKVNRLNGNASSQSQTPLSAFKSPTEVSRKPISAQRTAATRPGAKPDRSEYVARLQAAKGGKSGSGPSTTQSAAQSQAVKPQLSQKSPPISKDPAQKIEPFVSSAAASTPISKAVKTELARQRLEAFKAEQAARQNSKPVPTDTPIASSSAPEPAAALPTAAQPTITPAKDGLGAGLASIAYVADQQPTFVPTQARNKTSPALQPLFSPAPPTPSRSFSGLPGLFMNSLPPQQASPAVSSQPTGPSPTLFAQPTVPAAKSSHGTAGQTTSAASPSVSAPQTLLSRKRSVASNFNDDLAHAKRPFGQSRNASDDESYIIENSDEEEEDVHMDIETASGEVRAQPPSAQNLPAAMRTFSPKPALAQVSTPMTSGSITPGGVTYAQKLKAIEVLNRKIAEKEAKAKAQSKGNWSKGDAPESLLVLPGIQTPSRTGSALQIETGQAAALSTSSATPERSPSAAALKLKQQKEELSRRIIELESARLQGSAKAVATTVNGDAPELTAGPDAGLAGVQSSGNVEGAPKVPYIGDDARAALENGELDEESDFDFYGDEEAAAVDDAQLSADAEKVASQAPRVSIVTETDVVINAPQPALEGCELQSHTDKQDVDMGDSIESQSLEPSDTDYDARANIRAPDDGVGTISAVTESVQTQPLTPESDVEMETDASSSNDGSDEHESHLDGSVEFAQINSVRQGSKDEDESGSEVLVDRAAAASAARTEDQPELNDTESCDASSTRTLDPEDYEPTLAGPQTQGSSAMQAELAADDDLAPELRPSAKEQAEPKANDESRVEHRNAYYTPYESLMTRFKDYRYHPQYLETVPSGYKSRTYSHQIDPVTPICPKEAQDGVCDVPKCEWQHFEKMGVSDSALLQQMGTRNIPARTEEERARWNAGLQGVIKSLKAANVRDAATIAHRIVEYRWEFIDDSSKVLNLE